MKQRSLTVVAATMSLALAGCASVRVTDATVPDTIVVPVTEPSTSASGQGDEPVTSTVDDDTATSASTTTDDSTTTTTDTTTDDTTDTATTGEGSGWEPEPIDWDPVNDMVDAGLLDVPVDYDDPDGPTFELYLTRRPAEDPDRRIGSLLVNPGGPGFGGSDYAQFASFIFDRELLERFDIIGFDPRGTGLSEPAIDCVDDLDPYTMGDATPENEAESDAIAAVAREFAERCVEANGDIIEHVGTNNAARDIDSIRRALGEEQISYFGFSYGSELGGTWATLFPDTVRAAVLDGAADPDADALESSLQQIAGFEATLTTFLANCSDDPDCAFHNDGDAEAAFDALMERLDAEPIEGDPSRPPVNRTVALIAVAQAMYAEDFWGMLEEALAAADDGDGSGLLTLHDAYYQRQPDGSFGNELEAFQAISCADQVERPTREELADDAERLAEAGPRFAPEGSESYFCTFFPEALDPRIDITGDGAGPIVVIGATGDPATPFESTVRMSDTLEDGRLIVVEADQHTGYGLNRCVVEAVNDYLIDLDAPDDGTECR